MGDKSHLAKHFLRRLTNHRRVPTAFYCPEQTRPDLIKKHFFFGNFQFHNFSISISVLIFKQDAGRERTWNENETERNDTNDTDASLFVFFGELEEGVRRRVKHVKLRLRHSKVIKKFTPDFLIKIVKVYDVKSSKNFKFNFFDLFK